ncbi:delta(14)-sterol reductase TM7SF2-like isoform X2 [Physella acuta]|uniref:delta(14)-sterol reductase TM7SF2-like isoform X2 n=1 Tax=Physella acuta TaxID=109671 RepID=UPI0027DAB8F2|nr:delta(14)-sterol reductase TM7SF2-like isoform X2 [Physella acuta]
MPSPRKTSKSPARGKARGRSTSASRTKSTRSRSRSAGRKAKVVAAEASSVKDTKTVSEDLVDSKLIVGPVRSRSPARAQKKETSITKRSVITSYSNVSSSQEQASVTPVRTSTRIASLIEKEKEDSLRLREQMKSEMLSNIKTPPIKPASAKSKPSNGPHYEFMGPIGAFLLLFFLPLTVYYVNFACWKGQCSFVPRLPRTITSIFEVEATLIYLAWFFFQAFLAILPVGKVVDGQPLKSGGKLKYRCNGFFALVISLLMLGAAVYYKCPVTKVTEKFYKLMTTAIIFSFILSICLYIKSTFVSSQKLAAGGNTGNIIYDFFIGRELNPRIGQLDLKFFCELRPGLIGWVVMDWIMVVKAYQETQTFPPNLLLVTVFQTIYVADALWFEDAILTTMDIIHDGFGFMLAFGDLAWVPFLYCLQPRFLQESKFVLPWYCLAPIALLNVVGYIIFRMSNSQKNRFRNNPKDDAFSGFGHILTYFYPLYFLVLLIHRERRDNEQCQEKYGASWNKYCERVKYRIFPHVY